MTKRTSLRAAARARYRQAAQGHAAVPEQSAITPLPGAAPQEPALGARLRAPGGGRGQTVSAAATLPSIDGDRGKTVDPQIAVDTPLTTQARALYEDSVVPVREIARLAGVSERTLYRYVEKGGWRRRHRCRARDEAVAAANRGRRVAPAERFAPVKGAGGRFIRREDAHRPHARGIKALDPAGAAAAAAACAEAGTRSEAAVAQASAEMAARDARERAEKERGVALRSYARLSAALVELVAQRRERRPGAIAAADDLDARLQRVILGEMGRLIARR